jgi:aspartyl-tRNA(Asn)/glutamyl-tRNA(Gln) amidotransferase subunit A
VGLKPTFGRVSCYGVVPLAVSLDHAGPLATSVTGAAWLLAAVSGRDPRDGFTQAASTPLPGWTRSLQRPLGRAVDRPLARMRLGWPQSYFFNGVDTEVQSLLEGAARQFERLGARVDEIPLPPIASWAEAGTEIALAEARHYHESSGNFPARAADYGEDVRRLLERGAEISAPRYLAAMDLRRAARAAWEQAMADVDALLAPATPIAATPIGQKSITIAGEEQPVRAALIRLCRPANFVGVPALVLPCGFTQAGLPIGLQLIGRQWMEDRLLRIGYAYEQAAEWRQRHPPGI